MQFMRAVTTKMAAQYWIACLSQILILTLSIVCICYGKPHRKHQIDLAEIRTAIKSKGNDLFLLNNLIHHRTKRDCDSEDNWEPMTFTERISKHYEDGPEYIVLGNVLRLRNGGDPSRPYTGNGHYIAEVEIECVFKGYAFEAKLNISGFGPTDDCADTGVEVGHSYVIFLENFFLGYTVQEVNDQEGAREATRYLKSKVKSLYKCRLPYETTTVQPSSSESSSISDQGYSQYSLSIIPSSDSISFSSSYVDYDFPSTYEDYCYTSEESSSVSFESYSYYDYDKDGEIDFDKPRNKQGWGDLDEPRVELGSRDFRLIISVSGLGVFIFLVCAIMALVYLWKRRSKNGGSTVNLTTSRIEKPLPRDLIF